VSRFVPEEYRPDGGFSLIGLPILLGMLCAAGVGLGWLASFIGQWFYLILVFPLGIGLGLILVGVFVGHLAKMRSPGLAVLLGVVSAGVALLAMHYFNYQRFLKERPELPALLGKLPAEAKLGKLGEAVERLKQARAVDSFPSYLDLEATRGVAIRLRGKGFNLGYVGTWIYWVLELAGVAVLATLGLRFGAAAPFCSACNEWKEDRQLGTLQGKGDEVAAGLRSGDIEGLKKHNPAPTGGGLIVTAAVCPNCKSASPIAVKLEEKTKNAKGEEEEEERAHLTYPGEALTEFEALFGNEPEAKGET
jgi:hypothetical protein